MASGLEDPNLLPALVPLELSSAEDSLTEGEMDFEPTPPLEVWHLLKELDGSSLKHEATVKPLNIVSKHLEHLENLGPGRPQICDLLLLSLRLNLNTGVLSLSSLDCLGCLPSASASPSSASSLPIPPARGEGLSSPPSQPVF